MEQYVWFVEQGMYDDYRVIGVYSSLENAITVANFINDGKETDEATIEKRPLDQYLDQINEGYRIYFVRLGAETGKVFDCDEGANEDAFKYCGCLVLTINRQFINGNAWAKSKAQAIRIAKEFRQQKIEEGEI